MRLIQAAVASMALVVVLAGCSDVSAGIGSGPSGGSTPTYERLDARSYEYTLQIHCYCPNSGVPIRVAVEQGEAVSGVYAEDGSSGVQAGDAADRYTWLTLNDVIDAANLTDAYSVSVTWPPCQDWPDHISVDPEKNTIDEEYGYSVSDVVLHDGVSAPGCGGPA